MPRTERQRRSLMLRAWGRWLVLFVPFVALIAVASIWLDFKLIMVGLIVLVVCTLLFQRHINRRSWRSILWGVHATGE